jgi:hypothetical protein
VAARNGKPGRNQIPAELSRAVEKPQGMRLEFAGGISVDLPRAEFENQRENRDWVVEFPSDGLRVL